LLCGHDCAQRKPATRERNWLTLGVVANTGVLLSLKYLGPAAGTIAAAFGHVSPLGNIVAPLAISFYTFQQISFLVDVARGRVVLEGLVRYTSFVLSSQHCLRDQSASTPN
jgi:alginate O-acetyltransferase complex protein AlgI